MFLNKEKFAELIKNAPVVAIDLCIIKQNMILLGKRLNPPAESFYFVPGGRVRKGEKLDDTVIRLLKEELQYEFINNQVSKSLLGVYQHFYDDNFMGNNDFNSHYVTIAYLINFEELITQSYSDTKEQHSEYVWYEENKKFKNINIHKYSIDYLKHEIIQNILRIKK